MDVSTKLDIVGDGKAVCPRDATTVTLKVDSDYAERKEEGLADAKVPTASSQPVIAVSCGDSEFNAIVCGTATARWA